ncbi:MAG: 4-hydroxythreonine-4-phosphate dehydrogenase PdxA, partial [Planctomycetes bacterium]|nr:4-hydroxythreonine-4-phosphate dehydrogenase PdxA [Planctomycetota bacterium]
MPDTRIIITSGEPAGIGPDIVAAIDPRAFAARLVVIGDLAMLRARAAALGASVNYCAHGNAAPSGSSIEVIDQPLTKPCTPGKLDSANAGYVLAILEKACIACLDGEFD